MGVDELEPCPVCGGPGIIYYPQIASQWYYQATCARDARHLEVIDPKSAVGAIAEWNRVCRARRPL